MKAVVQYRYGGPDTLQLEHVGRPTIGSDQVSSGLRAASLNPTDLVQMRGFLFTRPQTGWRRPRQPVQGMDLAGLVEPSEQTSPGSRSDARKVRVVARIVNQLRFVLTPAATVEWFTWPRSDLDSRCPLDLLDDPAEEPRLTAIAGAIRGTLVS